MSFHLMLLSTNYRTLSAMKSLKQMANKCLFSSYSSSVVHRLKTTEDIKRFAINKLNPDKEVMNSRDGKEVLVYENSRHDFHQNLSFLSMFSYLLLVYVLNITLYWYLTEYKLLKQINDSIECRRSDENNDKLKSFVESLKQTYALNKRYVLLSALLMISGHVILIASVVFNIRSVSHIVVRLARRPADDSARLHCYSIFGRLNSLHKHDFPLKHMSALKQRLSSGRYIPIKVKGQLLRFRVDKKGSFVQPLLYDQTVGVFRKV